MRKTVVVGCAMLVGSVVLACGVGTKDDGARSSEGGYGGAAEGEKLGFQDQGLVQEFFVPVRGAATKLWFKRVGPASFEISFMKGDKTTLLFKPDRSRPVNMIADARAYGKTTLVCVNTFTSMRGDGAQVECTPLDTETGAVLGATTIAADSWLRTMSLAEPRAYVSPGQPFRYDEEGSPCRSVKMLPDGSLIHDPTTKFACDEAPKIIAKENVRGYKEPKSAAARVNGTGARTQVLKEPPVWARPFTNTAKDVHEQVNVPPNMNQTRQLAMEDGGALAPIAVATAVVDGDAGAPPPGSPPPVPPPPPPPPPADEEQVKMCGPRVANPQGIDFDPSQIPWLPSSVLSGNYVKTDCPAEGLTTGVSWNVTGKLKKITDPVSCIDDKFYGSLSANGTLMLGSKGYHIGGGGFIDSEKCRTPTCDTDTGEWTCADPSGSHYNWGFNVAGRAQFQIPLDTMPPLKPVCTGNWFGIGISCNIDISVGVAYQRNQGEAEGEAFCGSGCEDGQKTSHTNWSVGIDGSASLEVEASLGWFANGRIGVNIDGSYTYTSNEALACNNQASSSSSHCFKSSARVYASGCVGNLPGLSYCFNWSQRLYKIASGQCPPEPGDDAPNQSAGTAAGNMCAAQVTIWDWASRKDQCYGCCNKLPFPNPQVQSASEFDRDCKAVCDAEPWSN